MTSTSYLLINPQIRGKFKSRFDGDSPLKAASNAWKSVSKLVAGHMPEFYFSLQRQSNGKISHYVVREQHNGDRADYVVRPHSASNTPEELEAFLRLSEQKGGKSDKDKDKDESSSSSSSSSSSDMHRKKKHKHYLYSEYPMYNFDWWYYPLVYKVDRLYFPTFVSPLNPPLEVSLTYNLV